MTTWRERAKKLPDMQSDEVPKLPKAPFVTFGSESPDDIPDFFEVSVPANEAPSVGYGTGLDSFGYPLRPLVQCGDCQHYIRNAMTPEAGIGACQLGEPDSGGWPYHPGARRCCEQYTAIEVQA